MEVTVERRHDKIVIYLWFIREAVNGFPSFPWFFLHEYVSIERIFIDTVRRNSILLDLSRLQKNRLSGRLAIDADVCEPWHTIDIDDENSMTPHLNVTWLIHEAACPLLYVITKCREQQKK